MGTFTIIAIIVAVVAALIVLIAYISVLLDDRRYYKMIAERWEEAFDSMAQNPEMDGAGSMAYFAELNESRHEVMNGIDKHLY